MRLVSETIDDIQHRVLSKLLQQSTPVVQATRGEFRELLGVTLVLTNPRARLGRGIRQGRLFSCLGELLWYLSGSNSLDFISYYIPKYREESADGMTIKGSYGERLFRSRQIYRVLRLLRTKKTSRRAVLQIFMPKDLNNPKEVPCTISLQFIARDGKLDLIASMRSNDALFGLPHDIFSFTMIQEIAARHLGLKLGKYTHFVGSLHLYSDQLEKAQNYVDDGLQRRVPMPPMPLTPPLPRIKVLVRAESSIRATGKPPEDTKNLEKYWIDLVVLLRAFYYIKKKDTKGLHRMKARLSNDHYHQYIEMKAAHLAKSPTPKDHPFQSLLDLSTR